MKPDKWTLVMFGFTLALIAVAAIKVEDILAAIPTEGMHEQIANTLASLGGEQRIKARHSGVKIVTYRGLK